MRKSLCLRFVDYIARCLEVYDIICEVQCESKIPPPLRFSDIFSQTVGNL